MRTGALKEQAEMKETQLKLQRFLAPQRVVGAEVDGLVFVPVEVGQSLSAACPAVADKQRSPARERDP